MSRGHYNRARETAAVMDRIEDLTQGRHSPIAMHHLRRIVAGLGDAWPVVITRNGSVRVGAAGFCGRDADLLAALAGRLGIAIHVDELAVVAGGGADMHDLMALLAGKLVGTDYRIACLHGCWYRMERR